MSMNILTKQSITTALGTFRNVENRSVFISRLSQSVIALRWRAPGVVLSEGIDAARLKPPGICLIRCRAPITPERPPKYSG